VNTQRLSSWTTSSRRGRSRRQRWCSSPSALCFDHPLPGAGRTVERLQALTALGTLDGSLARLAEGHLDALALVR
jgi:hypothetical protein